MQLSDEEQQFAFAALANEKMHLAIITTKTEALAAMELAESRRTRAAQQSAPADAAEPRR